MASEKFDDRDDLAFQIFSKRATSTRRTGEREALAAYAQADAFLSAREKIKTGKVKQIEEVQTMADCSAPNLPRTHPLNLIAQTYTDRRTGKQYPGDLAKVKQIKAWLDKTLTPNVNPEELAERLAADFPELRWDLPTINVARAVLPHYATN
jgi:hypothetical protein